MLLDLEPKSKREDLYNFENELEMLKKGMETSKMVVVSGLRRTGKTSLIKVALNEVNIPYLYLDPRFSMNPNYRDFVELLKKGLEDFLNKNRSLIQDIQKVTARFKGLKILLAPLSVEVTWRGKEKVTLQDLLLALNKLAEIKKTKVVIVVDEAQELKKVNWIRIDRTIAFAYDNLDNIRFLFSGSQVGLLYDFLGIENPKAPLYGRGFIEVRTRRLSREESLDFLIKGLKQFNVEPNFQILEKAVDEIDGIIGWLTYFGHVYAVTRVAEIEPIMSAAVNLAVQELNNFILQKKSNRYKILLKLLVKERTWANLKRQLEEKEGRTINSRTFSELISNLIKSGIVEKSKEGIYYIPDPITRKAAEKIT